MRSLAIKQMSASSAPTCHADVESDTLDAVIGLYFLGAVESFLVAMIPNRDIRASFSQRLGNDQADASTGAGNNRSLALEAEQREDLGFFGGGGVVVDEITALYHLTDILRNHDAWRMAARRDTAITDTEADVDNEIKRWARLTGSLERMRFSYFADFSPASAGELQCVDDHHVSTGYGPRPMELGG